MGPSAGSVDINWDLFCWGGENFGLLKSVNIRAYRPNLFDSIGWENFSTFWPMDIVWNNRQITKVIVFPL